MASRTWICAIVAPRFQQRTASAAISSGVTGSAGFCSFVPALPVSATETITLSLSIHPPYTTWRPAMTVLLSGQIRAEPA